MSMPEDIDDSTGIPRYIQVARIVEHEIRDGVWIPGSVVPSVNTLSQRFGVARTTVQKAHARLAERGMVSAVPGVGMAVRPRKEWAAPEE